jgi:hypothetical protein
MRKLIVTTTFFIVLTMAGSAQDYQGAFGYRGGPSNGLTLKYFIQPDIALEGLLTARFGGYNITGLYEIHKEPFSVSNLYFYYGFGGHIGSWQTVSGKHWWDDGINHTVIGADGIAGIEYNFDRIPLNLSLDYKPGLNIIGYPKFWSDEFSISVRYYWGNR